MKLGIIGALSIEINSLIKDINNIKTHTIATKNFYEGKINGIDIIIAQAGIGMVNATITTQIMIDIFNPDYIINTGIAGSLDNNINLGDVVISTDLVEYRFDVTPAYKLGQIPELDAYSFMSSQKLRNMIEDINLNNIKIHVGRIISGDKFMSNINDKVKAKKEFNALAVEMEGAAIAHTCYMNNIPFCVIRSISDNADNDADTTYYEFCNIAAKNSAKIVSHIINKLQQKASH